MSSPGRNAPSPEAEIVSVGSELLLGQIVDTHAATLAGILADVGIACRRRSTCGDNSERLKAMLRESLARVDIVLTIGGLGPTEDDVTREAIAEALNDTLVYEPEAESSLRAFFAQRGVPYVESNTRQAYRPSCAKFIPNPNGTAPGLVCEKGAKRVIAMPGPAGEFVPMATGFVKCYLGAISGERVIHSRTLRVCGLGESAVEEKIRRFTRSANPSVAPYAHTGEVHLRVTASAPTIDEADRLIDPVDDGIRKALGDTVFGVDGTSLEQAVIQLLAKHKAHVAVAESLTGGLIGGRLTAVPGASQVFAGGVVAYTVESKRELLGLEAKLLAEHGPVSEQVAWAMAEMIRKKLNAEYALGIVGNAGPTSDIGRKPIGLTYVAVLGPAKSRQECFQFSGGRENVRARATQEALVSLRRLLLDS